MDVGGIDFTGFDDVFRFDNRDLRVPGHGPVEIVRR
jgi:hypothetical protein